MGSYSDTLAVASATLNTNIFSGKSYQTRGIDRVITGFGLVGSAAAGDTVIELMVGEQSIGTFRNEATGAQVKENENIIALQVAVPAGEPINAIVRDAPATNDIYWKLKTIEMG